MACMCGSLDCHSCGPAQRAYLQCSNCGKNHHQGTKRAEKCRKALQAFDNALYGDLEAAKQLAAEYFKNN